MLAVYFEKGRAEMRAVPRPRLRRGFALIRLRMAGICNTDIELLRGYYGFAGIPGHEFVGDVVAAEDNAWVGKRVVGEINLACGNCAACRAGMGRHCSQRKVLGIVGHPGAFAEYLTLPLANLLPVPRTVPDEEAVFAEPIAAAWEILEQLRLPKRSRIAVLGDGKLGLLVAQALCLAGMHVEAFGRNANKLAVLGGFDIPTFLVNRDTPDLPIGDYPYVVDATGSVAGFENALRMVKPRGTIVLKSTVRERVAVDMAAVIVNEITLLGSRCGRFGPAMRLLRSKQLNLQEMISLRAPLASGVAALAASERPGCLKVLLTP